MTNRKAVPTLPPAAPLTPLALTDDVADAPAAANVDAAKAKTLFRTRKATAVTPRSTTTTTPTTTGGAAASDATAKPKRELFSIGKTVKPEVVMAFSRQLASFLEAGISVLEALEIVALETDSTPMKVVIADIRTAVQRGSSFVDAVAAHPKVFPDYYRAMVMSAEFTGHLDVVLAQLATYLERDIAARRQVKSALTYPVIVLIVAVAAMIVMSVFVLPKFSGLYRSLGARLPLPTRILLDFTDFVTGSWPTIFLALVVIIGGGYALIGGRHGKKRRDRVAMRLPIVGKLFHLISLERFCRVLSALSTAGVPLPDAIEVSADSTNNTLFTSKLATVRETLIRGGGLYAPLIESGIFPIAARQMIRVGEKTGSLGNQLHKAATYYEREVTFSMKRATDLFEPTVIFTVGIIVGFVAVAQVAAMYSIFGQIH